MDYLGFVDALFSPACVVSVEEKQDGGYKEIRLIAGNKKYTDMIDMRKDSLNASDPDKTGTVFVCGSLYTDYFPKNQSFEDVCYKAAVLKRKAIPTFTSIIWVYGLTYMPCLLIMWMAISITVHIW